MLFTFPSRYSFAIGLSVVFSLSGWSPIIQPEFLVLRPTQVPTSSAVRLRVRGSHPLWPHVPEGSTDNGITICRSYNPGTRVATPPVWAPPRSLAATGGIVVTFSSCGYLDVSVPRVRLLLLQDGGIAPAGLPHSEIHGSMGICPLPWLIAACHVLLRLREPRHPPCALHTFRFSVMHEVHRSCFA